MTVHTPELKRLAEDGVHSPSAHTQPGTADSAREPYQPGSGSEGAAFMAIFCDRCEADAPFRAGTGDSCPIVANTMIFDEADELYPVEWRQDGPQGPRCTAFREAIPAASHGLDGYEGEAGVNTND